MNRARPALSGLLAALLVLASGAATEAGRRARLPETTTEGRFPGTWYYNSAGLRIAFFLREAETGPEMKVRWEARSGHQFETDWTGNTAYVYRGFPARVSFRIDPARSDADRIEGDYTLSVELEAGDRSVRSGSFAMERVFDGRILLWNVPVLTEERRTGETVTSSESENYHYILARASYRVVPWEDIIW